MKQIKLKLSELVFDFNLYPRTQVDSTHVSAMCEADRAGVKFPPYRIDEKSRRVIDGFHRGAKDKREHGPDCAVECETIPYKDETQMFLAAVQMNASHGRPLSPFDKARCALRCKRFRVNAKQIASILGITVETLKAIGEGRVAKSTRSKAGQPDEVALKSSIRHMKGLTLTEEQETANDKLSGMNQVFHANQLLLLIESDLLDRNDEVLMAALTRLHSALGIVVAVMA